MKMMKAAVALGMALTMTVTGASAVFAEGESLSVATDFEIKTLVPWAAFSSDAAHGTRVLILRSRLWYRGLHPRRMHFWF